MVGWQRNILGKSYILYQKTRELGVSVHRTSQTINTDDHTNGTSVINSTMDYSMVDYSMVNYSTTIYSAMVNYSATNYSTMTQRLPSCIIIGVRKCGTSALLEFLNLHPAIVSAEKELTFFNKNKHYARGLAYYRSLMPQSRADQYTIEKTPSYYDKPEVTSRMRDMNASLRLLLIVREPVTRLVSDYTDKVLNGPSEKRNISFEVNLLFLP